MDWSICRQFLENIQEVILRYPDVKIICTNKAYLFMGQFGFNVDGRVIEVKDGDTMSFGKHNLIFVSAPMVHWPEAIVTFDTTSGVLFSADAFGAFGSLDGKLFKDEINFDSNWIDDNRRYYTNIVGKYGTHVQALLKKASGLDIKIICSLHGPVWRDDLKYLLDRYKKWSLYEPEKKGVMIENDADSMNDLADRIIQSIK